LLAPEDPAAAGPIAADVPAEDSALPQRRATPACHGACGPSSRLHGSQSGRPRLASALRLADAVAAGCRRRGCRLSSCALPAGRRDQAGLSGPPAALSVARRRSPSRRLIRLHHCRADGHESGSSPTRGPVGEMQGASGLGRQRTGSAEESKARTRAPSEPRAFERGGSDGGRGLAARDRGPKTG
jgi:hypothetical protein